MRLHSPPLGTTVHRITALPSRSPDGASEGFLLSWCVRKRTLFFGRRLIGRSLYATYRVNDKRRAIRPCAERALDKPLQQLSRSLRPPRNVISAKQGPPASVSSNLGSCGGVQLEGRAEVKKTMEPSAARRPLTDQSLSQSGARRRSLLLCFCVIFSLRRLHKNVESTTFSPQTDQPRCSCSLLRLMRAVSFCLFIVTAIR